MASILDLVIMVLAAAMTAMLFPASLLLCSLYLAVTYAFCLVSVWIRPLLDYIFTHFAGWIRPPPARKPPAKKARFARPSVHVGHPTWLRTSDNPKFARPTIIVANSTYEQVIVDMERLTSRHVKISGPANLANQAVVTGQASQCSGKWLELRRPVAGLGAVAMLVTVASDLFALSRIGFVGTWLGLKLRSLIHRIGYLGFELLLSAVDVW
ncbi:hypothetical protein N656DRAFT_801557 [Canariomyces notabilis]|uniref:Uncharacterized protein n=1 Tax=Canariomyces notabilis TaxID=2074819 RepID=A0AAN6QIJ9_9PEZI|nr:hypothetical protein N656DRAFT_801557 [Canariomyces arenarius]